MQPHGDPNSVIYRETVCLTVPAMLTICVPRKIRTKVWAPKLQQIPEDSHKFLQILCLDFMRPEVLLAKHLTTASCDTSIG